MITLEERVQLLEELLEEELKVLKDEKSRKDMRDRTVRPEEVFTHTTIKRLVQFEDGTMRYVEEEL